MVLVFEAMRKWVSAAGGVCVPNSVVPTVAVNLPCGVRISTNAPGTSIFLALRPHDGLKRGRIDAT